MTIRGMNRGAVAQVLAAMLVAALCVGAPAAWAAGPATSAKPATVLTVLSEPAGAAVYVDGDLKGATPVALEDVAAGDHTVRLVKNGFLENSRLLAVPAGGRSVQVRLTPTAPSAAMQVEPTAPAAKSGGSSKKWLLIGLGAAAVGAGAFVALRDTNKAPTVSGVSANPTPALQGTGVSFSATATDPDGDSLTYSWNFGDGATGTGASPTHVYDGAGTFSVSVEVSDGKKKATGSCSADVRGLAGRWAGNFANGYPFVINFAQSGANLSGSYQAAYGAGPLTGNVTPPLGVRFTVNVPGYYPFNFNGTVGSSLNSITGTASDPGGTTTFTLNRQ